MKRKTVVFATILSLVLSVDASAKPRVALVLQGEPDPATVALGEVRLSESDRFDLVERREIDKVLREREIVDFNVDDAVRLGPMLGVTQFVVLRQDGLVVFDTKYGLRLADASLPEDPERAAGEIARRVRQSLDFRLKDADLYGILELRNAELGRGRDAWCFALGNMLERALLSGGAIVVERSRLEHLNKERLLPTETGTAGSELLTTTKFVNLEFKRGKDADAFRLEATVGDKTLRADGSFRSPGEAVDKIATELTAGSSDTTTNRPDRKAEAARFYREADRLHFGGYLPQALEYYEAAYALAPENVAYLRRLCNQLGYIAEGTMSVRRPVESGNTTKTWENVSRSLEIARRILDLIEYSNKNDGKTDWYPFAWTNYMNRVDAVPDDVHPDWPGERRRFWDRVVRVHVDVEYPEFLRMPRDFRSLGHFIQVVNQPVEFKRYAPMELWFEHLDRRIRDFFRLRKQFSCKKSADGGACTQKYCLTCRIPYDRMHFFDLPEVVLAMPQHGTVAAASEKFRDTLRFMTEEGNRYDANAAWLVERKAAFRKEAGLAYSTPEQYARHAEAQRFSDFGSLLYVGESAGDSKSPAYENARRDFAADIRKRIDERPDDTRAERAPLLGALRGIYEHYCRANSFERDFWINFNEVSEEDLLGVRDLEDLRKLESAWKDRNDEIARKTPAPVRPWVSEHVLLAAGRREPDDMFKRIRIAGDRLCVVKHVEKKSRNTIAPVVFDLKTLERTDYPEIEVGETYRPPFRNYTFAGISLDLDDENIYLGVFGHGIRIYPIRGGEPVVIDEAAGLPSNLVQGLGRFHGKLYVGLGSYRATGYLVAVDMKTREVEILSSSAARTGIAPFFNRPEQTPEFHGFYRDEKRNRLLFNVYEGVYHGKTINGIWAFEPETNSFTRLTRSWAQGEVLPLPGGDALLIEASGTFYLLDLNDDSCRPIASTMRKEAYVEVPKGFDYKKSVHHVFVRNCTVLDGWIWTLAETRLNQFGPKNWVRLKLFEPGRSEPLRLPEGIPEQDWLNTFYDILATPDGKGIVVSTGNRVVLFRMDDPEAEK